MQYKWIFIAAMILLAVTACKNNTGDKDPATGKDIMQQKKEATVYTCSMHHQIRSDKPGKCPICGMTLIPVENNAAKKTNDTVAMLSIPPQQQLLANIHTDTALVAPLSDQLVLTGTTLFDPRKTKVISAWVGGWIEKMYVRNPGEKVMAGQKLYELYSPDLLSAEKDYLLTLKQKDLFKKASIDFTATLKAMRQKLLRWGLSESQINRLSQEQPTGKVTIYSKSSGYLTQKMKEEGDHVNEGEAVLSLAENKTLWVQAQLYDTELSLMNADPKIWVELDAFPGEKLFGKVVFNNPVNKNDSRVHLLNISISNPNGKIQPGMLAYVFLQTSGGKPALLIPKSAIIYGEKNNYVWVRQPNDSSDLLQDRFERRKVKLGKDNNTMVQILQGIKAGEVVVYSGAYLVNSEYILKYGSGANLSGMQMSDMKMKGKAE